MDRRLFEYARDYALAVVILLSCIYSGCKAKPPSQEMLTITRNDNNKQFAVTAGQELQIALSENPTTGFRWQVQAWGKPVLEFLQEDFDSAAGGVGRGGTRRWRFKAVQEGSAGIEMAYRRASDPDQSPAETFTVTVRVER